MCPPVRAVPSKSVLQNQPKILIAPACFFVQRLESDALAMFFGHVQHIDHNVTQDGHVLWCIVFVNR